MKYLLLLLTLLLAGCEPPQTFEDEDDMAQKYPRTAPVPVMGAPLVAPVIPRNGGWSGDNQLGALAKYSPDNRGRQTILKLDEWGPPEVWTVSLYVNQQLRSFSGFSISAEINFGAGGGTQVLEIDWVNGAQISVPMNAVNVIARFENVDAADEGAGLQLGVQLARGSRGGIHSPVRTIAENITVASLAQSPTFEIPKFARTLYAVSTGGTANNIDDPDIVLLSLAGNFSTFVTGSVNGSKMSNGVGLPVVGSARRVRLSNGSAGDIQVTLYAEIEG